MAERRGTKGLELWCRKMTEGYPGVSIQNMTSSWRDGLAFCAIIHHFRPDLIDFSKLNKDDVYHNNELAFRIAEQYLGIPALLEPEDMVEYEVPDRLSILTYLAQFFQAFGDSHGSQARLAPKRPANTTERPKMPAPSSSPPTKISVLNVGRPRREPCAKCGLPVFIAERLNVGKQLYHRVCFRCARCNSQLTLSNYYETETEKQYCCETCPDEEKTILTENTESSNGKTFLNRSISDEEKTAGLLVNEENDNYSEVFETALENDTSLEKTDTLSRNSEFTIAMSEFINSQIDNDDDNSENIIPPSLPSSEPPDIKTLSELNGHSDNFIVNIDNNNITNNESTDSGLPTDTNSLDSVTVDNSISDSNQLTGTAGLKLENENIVTKDISKTFPQTSTPLVTARKNFFENKCNEISFVKKIGQLDTDAQNILKSEMHSLDNKPQITNVVDKNTRSDSISNDLVVDNIKIQNDEEVATIHQEELSNNDKNFLKSEELESENIIIIDSSTDESDTIIVIDSSNDEKCSAEVIVIEDSFSNDTTNPFAEKDAENAMSEKQNNTLPVCKELYPEELNPFDENVENETVVPIPARRKKIANTTKISLNPFEDLEDEIENDSIQETSVLEEKKRTFIPASKISLQPFWEDDKTDMRRQNDNIPTPTKRLSISKNGSPYGSNNSISGTSTFKTKKPAPRPPIHTLTTDKKSESSSTSSSPRSMPKYRKNKKAPLPPGATPSPSATTKENIKTIDACMVENNLLNKTISASTSVEKDKQNKEVINENRRSIIYNATDDKNTPYFSVADKSTHGIWKRKKGPAPPKPIPQKRTVKSIPIGEIRSELHLIELQQQGLEKQGVRLEEIIRDKCEGPEADDGPISIEVEDLILQLFEVVNEKNELCRKQAELMYIQRQQRLEEEYAEIEYQIRCLLVKPEANKTDYDKAREDELIARLVTIVEKRNEIIECLDMDRLREAEEDDSINTHMNNFTMKRDEHSTLVETETKTIKKKNKKDKKSKSKSTPKFDIDKDIDETEVSKSPQVDKLKLKKKKKFNLF